MKKIFVTGAALMLLAACGTTDVPKQSAAQASPTATAATSVVTDKGLQLANVDSIDSRVEVAYRCDSSRGKMVMKVMYGVKDGTLVVAQTLVNGQPSPGLFRVLNDPNGDTQNSYFGEGITWITAKATPATVAGVNGHMLTQAGTTLVNGQRLPVDRILLKSCVIDRPNQAGSAQP